MSCALGWHGTLTLTCFFINFFCAGVILSNSYWRRRIAGLSKMLDGLKAQQNLVNQFHTGEIDKEELTRRLAVFYGFPGTMH